jgi:hypothetical protein
MAALIEELRRRRECEVAAPAGMPLVAGGLELPDDLQSFYELCGGVVFDYTVDRKYEFGFAVVSPDRFLPINEVVLGEQYEDDPSASWYLIAEADDSGTADRFSIDLNADRGGRIFDSFWDRHGLAGSMDVVANSFTEFLARLSSEGRYWLADGFSALGDAYD